MYGFCRKFLNFWKVVSFNYNSWKVRFRPEIIKFSKKTLVSTSHAIFLTRSFRGRNFYNSRNVRFGQEILKFLKRRTVSIITRERYGFGRKLLNFLKRRKFLQSHAIFLTRSFRGRNFITQEMYGFCRKF
jgi:hypothetical protein